MNTLEPETTLANRLVGEVPGAYRLTFDAGPTFALVRVHFRDGPDAIFRGEDFLAALRAAHAHFGLPCES